MGRQQPRHIGQAAVDRHAQVFAKPAARLLQAPHLRDSQLHATGKAVGLQLAHDDHQFIVFEQLAVRGHQGLIGAGVYRA